MVAQVAPTLDAPLVLFTYYNPIIRRGMDKFCQQIKAAGAAGASGNTYLLSRKLVEQQQQQHVGDFISMRYYLHQGSYSTAAVLVLVLAVLQTAPLHGCAISLRF